MIFVIVKNTFMVFVLTSTDNKISKLKKNCPKTFFQLIVLDFPFKIFRAYSFFSLLVSFIEIDNKKWSIEKFKSKKSEFFFCDILVVVDKLLFRVR